MTTLYCSCEQAEQAKMHAREAVVLLEQARMLLREDNAVQLAMKHTDEAIREADRRAVMLEDWYRRTYSPADAAAPLPIKLAPVRASKGGQQHNADHRVRR